MAKYLIAPGTSITSKGVVFESGKEVSADNFISEEVFNNLVKGKKILSESDYTKVLAGEALKEEKSEKKAEEKKSEAKAEEKASDENKKK